MRPRHLARAVGMSAGAALAGSLAMLALSTSPAWANGEQVPNSAQCNTTATGPCGARPFDSGQQIQVEVPANTTLPSSASVNIVECSAAVLTATSDVTALPDCDGLTIQGDTVITGSGGTVNYTNYTIYALPDTVSLGETAGSQPQCDSSHPCVLYIGTDQTHPYSSAHVWSQTWLVNANGTDVATNPGDGTPEVPLAIGLPLLGLGLAGGMVMVRRRRSAAGSRA